MRLRLFLLFFLLPVMPRSAAASTIYTYVGNPYTSAQYPFNTSESIDGNFTVASPLADDLTLTHIDPTSFSFSNGYASVTNGSSFLYTPTFEVSTDASGRITAWLIDITTSTEYGFSTANIPANDPGDEGSEGVLFGNCNSYCFIYDFYGSNSNDPGTWTSPAYPPANLPAGAAPEPASLILLGTGALGLCGALRRRF